MLEVTQKQAGFDAAFEWMARLLAKRMTRRSFIGWFGRAAVLVAGGSTFVGLLAGRAEARVCGQSGVSPKCPNYDCIDAVWGWCWYANGCCAGGRLKKICDCCAPVNNVHGYCPSGTNVKCIVESCGADPRLQTVAISRIQTDHAVEISTALSRARFARNAKPVVVLSNAEEPLSAGIAATVASAVGGPLLLTGGGGLDSRVIAELQRLGSTDVKVVGLNLSGAVDAGLNSYGRAAERLSAAGDYFNHSSQVADWVRARTGTARAVCVEPTGSGRAMAPLAGVAAGSKGMIFIVGAQIAAAKANNGIVLTYMVGHEASARANEVAGSKAVRSGDSIALASELAGYMTNVEKASVASITLAPWDTNPGLAASPGLVLLHARPGALDGARDWMFANRGNFRRVYAVGAAGGLNNDGYYETQSLVNGFEAHLLIGVAGQGLPVIEQPAHERPIGRARTRAYESAPASSSYWTDRA